MSDLTKEKERLMREVLGRKRAYEIENEAACKREDLNQKLDEVQSHLKEDYGLHTKDDEKQIFKNAQEYLEKKIKGQDEAVGKLVNAFRRPYVMGTVENSPAAVILVDGPDGTGRHTSLRLLSAYLHEAGLFQDGNVYLIDLSRYPSAQEEQVFLQDLYEALNSTSPVICFENAGACSPAYIRMINELAVNGQMHLNKRYVLTNNVLVENQSGLVNKTVDSLKAMGKYLVFLQEDGQKSIQDVFGNEMLSRMLDQVHFVSLNEKAAEEIRDEMEKSFQERCQKQLGVKVEISDALKKWMSDAYDKEKGAEGLKELFDGFFVKVSDALMQEESIPEKFRLDIDDKPYMMAKGQRVELVDQRDGDEEIAEINRELDQIVGLTKVKQFVHSLEASAEMNERRRRQGLKSEPVTGHMIFTGNPGTGKTTIARLLARYLKAAGVLSEGQMVEVSRSDLVARYVGQTAPLTLSVIKSALGGVLFIDEAYSLYRGKDDSFGLEAIDTLVKAMEDYRNDLIVILAGYKKEMEMFLDANSGLKSRFPNIIEFPDYTGQELLEIAQLQAEKKGYRIESDALEPLKQYFDTVQKEKASEAGNGRLARNVIEKAILHQAERAVHDEKADLSLLKREDFVL